MAIEQRFDRTVESVESTDINTCSKCLFNNVECYSSATARLANCMASQRANGVAVYYIEDKEP